MTEDIRVFGDFFEKKIYRNTEDVNQFDLSSTFRLRAASINKEKLWHSKDKSAEFLGDIWSLFVDESKEVRIKTILHSICVELIENAVKYGQNDLDYMITVELCLKSDEILIYVFNTCESEQADALESSARFLLESDIPINDLFMRKMKEAKQAKKKGISQSQLGFIRILMQGAKLAWQIRRENNKADVTSLARVLLNKEGDN